MTEQQLSPSESYAKSKQNAKFQELVDFKASLAFGLDDFQEESCRALNRGNGVLVAAPTGAGKTVVGEFAIHLAMTKGLKVFYTTPIKALSNQKYAELQARYGKGSVGLLTGDSNQNSNAQVVVMTTEVLRNMIYANSDSLKELGYVVMDEVHYLADRFRGAVWEEVILHLPKDVKIVSLSATVSNAEEFGAWLAEVRGNTEIVVSEHRPVPLHQHVLFGDELVELFDSRAKTRQVNPELVQKHQTKLRTSSHRTRNGKRPPPRGMPSIHKLTKPEVVEVLDDASMLPAIFFIFSRAGCEAAVTNCRLQNLRLTTREQQEEIRKLVEARCASIADEDLGTLGYFEWLTSLERGFAAHHAGMLPAFKEVVEELFLKKLVKVVFATETLALGINMPARTVVLERLDKYNGESRVGITPGEYTQLTGRAGRRGIDIEGHSVIQWGANLEPNTVAGLASKRTYPLNSSFKPTYNMGVNLIQAFGADRAREVLELSFAQFQADRSVVGIAKDIKEKQKSLLGYEESLSCDRGEFKEYARIKREISDLEKELSRRSKDLRESKGRHTKEQHIANLKRQLRSHPCHHCPERDSHSRWGERYFRLKKDVDKELSQIEGRTNRVSRTFDRITEVLVELNYVEEVEGELEVTPAGQRLARIYGERDLLIAECLKKGAWKGLDEASFASLAIALLYEGRRDEADFQPRVPKGQFAVALEATEKIQEELAALQLAHSLNPESQLELGMCYAVFRWANGASLPEVLKIAGLLPGDFIRWTKQLIDLLDQLSKSADSEIAEMAYRSVDKIKRGIVAYSYYI